MEDPSQNLKEEENQKVIKFFKDTVIINQNAIHVRFPWNGNQNKLADNYAIALKRLEQQFYNLSTKSNLWQQYADVIKDQLARKIIEPVDELIKSNNITYYIPHQAVIKSSSNTTKLRIVLDASSHYKGTPSLNDCIFPGPTFLPDLCGALLRSRTYPILLISDIEKAFHMIHLQEQDRDATRFLFIKNINRPPTPDNLITYRFKRIPFGVCASPFLLAQSIITGLEYQNTTLSREILRNIYVDNVMFNVKNTEHGIATYHESKKIFQNMEMNLREFISNDQSVNKIIKAEDSQKGPTVKLLGIMWNTKSDTYELKINDQILKSNSKRLSKLSKRTTLKFIAEQYDPLGFLSPLLIKLKVFQQELWKQKFDWDQPFDEKMEKQWKTLTTDIFSFKKSLTRFICPGFNSLDKTDCSSSLAIFSDASALAVATVAYHLNNTNSFTSSNLLMAKTKVAPIKPVTIPRLELIGLYMAVNLAMYLVKELDLPINSVTFFCDSKVTLSWLSNETKHTTFVSNKCKAIKQKCDSLQEQGIRTHFYYVNTKSNPADCATRGLTKDEINNHFWWTGPAFLKKHPSNWPQSVVEKFDMHQTKETMVSTVVTEHYKSPINFSSTNSYTKLRKVVHYVLKFIQIKIYSNLSKESKHTFEKSFRNRTLFQPEKVATSEELNLKHTELILIREHQKESQNDINNLSKKLILFFDENHIIRCKGRMDNSSLPTSAKTPILLLPKHPLTTTIINFTHKINYHQGYQHTLAAIREHFWIPTGRQSVRSTLYHCITCKKFNARPYKYPDFPSLPTERVTPSQCFTHCGLDYMGPITTKENDQTVKIWICLITCMSTRAIHLEIVSDNSTIEFLLALRRFMARRGTPTSITSDNAPTFKLGAEILRNNLYTLDLNKINDFLTNANIKWKYITPLTPFQGGFYERLVGSVKNALYKTISFKKLTRKELETIIIECESIINTRPLTKITNLEDSVLRPIDFLIPKFNISQLEITKDNDPDFKQNNTLNTREQALQQFKQINKHMNQFWNIWNKLYLSELREHHTRGLAKGNHGKHLVPKIGDIVIVSDKSLPRQQWPIAIITELHPSSDNQIRSVTIKSNNHTFSRSVAHLYPLELNHSLVENDAALNITNETLKSKQKHPRQAKQHAKQLIHKLFNE